MREKKYCTAEYFAFLLACVVLNLRCLRSAVFYQRYLKTLQFPDCLFGDTLITITVCSFFSVFVTVSAR